MVRSFLRKPSALDTLPSGLVLDIAGRIQLLVVDFELRGKSVKESQTYGNPSLPFARRRGQQQVYVSNLLEAQSAA